MPLGLRFNRQLGLAEKHGEICMTRDQAIELARAMAVRQGDEPYHEYQPTPEAARMWMPHEWVIAAIISAGTERERATGYRCIKPQCANNCDGCNCAVSEADDAAMLVVDLLNAFAVDGHGGPLEDGESQLVDRARAWLAARPQANVDAEVGARWRANSSLEEWFPITAEKLKPLTDEQIASVAESAIGYDGNGFQDVHSGDLRHFARLLEQAHGIGPNVGIEPPRSGRLE